MEYQTIIQRRELLEITIAIELLPISDLQSTTSDQEIVNFFEKYTGSIESLTTNYNSYGGHFHKAFIINFHHPNDARKALFYNGTLLGYGRRMHLKLLTNQKRASDDEIAMLSDNFHQSNSEEKKRLQPQELDILNSPETTQDFFDEYLFVSNLTHSVTKEQIFNFFEKLIGPVQSVCLHFDNEGFQNGKASIIFRQPNDARKGIFLGEQRLEGRKMILKLFVNGKLIRIPSYQPSQNWISGVPFVSLASLNSIAEYLPGDPILGTTFTLPYPSSKLNDDNRSPHPQGPGIPPFLPLVFVKDCIRPYQPPAFGFN